MIARLLIVRVFLLLCLLLRKDGHGCMRKVGENWQLEDGYGIKTPE